MKTATERSIIEDILIIIQYSVKLANTNKFKGIESFNNLANKRASGDYLVKKLKYLKTTDFQFWNIQDLTDKAKEDVKRNLYTDNVKKLINHAQEVKL